MPLQDIEHPKLGKQQYMDGGIRDVIPIRAAWLAGATRIFAIALSEQETASTEDRFDGSGSVVQLLMRVLLGLLNQEVADGDISEARYLATIGRLARLVPKERLDEALSLIVPEERARFTGDDTFRDLLVHRPASSLNNKITWTKQQMTRWIADGEAVAETPEGRRIDEFLKAA